VDKLILLDRDGVLNRVVVDPEHGTIDSPLNPSQVKVFDGIPFLLFELNRAGYQFAIVTNQPAAAKGKTTAKNLQATHDLIVSILESEGAQILSSHICFHRSEDGCSCRKPKAGLLEAAFKANPGFSSFDSWMVGDGVTDIQAGAALGLNTAFLGPRKCDACKIFSEASLEPSFWGRNFIEFGQFLLKNAQ
jgi:histidinol-phosphate phosphatase family protein